MKTDLSAEILYKGQYFFTELNNPIDISIPFGRTESPNAFYLGSPKYHAVEAGSFTGDVRRGGSCNCEDITFNPHGSGTHTECAGHITGERIYISKLLKQNFFLARLISVDSNAESITADSLKSVFADNANHAQALILRILPNNESKLQRIYSGTSPMWFDVSAVNYINSLGIDHILTDLPSLDKEDDPDLTAHKTFFGHPEKWNLEKTVTEMVYVPDTVSDGLYFLSLQPASFETDAAPSTPVLYPARLIA
jgi:arylformamidase